MKKMLLKITCRGRQKGHLLTDKGQNTDNRERTVWAFFFFVFRKQLIVAKHLT